MRVASVQFNASRSKDENLKRILSYIEYASKLGIELIVFPEYSMFFPLDKDSLKHSEYIDGGFLGEIRRSARDCNVNVVVNFSEKSNDKAGRVYDTSVLISSSGEVLSVYRKTHLFDAFNVRESDYIVPGDSLAKPVRLGDFNVGLLICYDIRFPEAARSLAIDGCTLLCVSSAWYGGVLKEVHLLTMILARAIENGIYVVMANQTQPRFCGRSCIVDPYGVVLADAGEREGVMIHSDISIDRLNDVRRSLPLLSQRRPELYLQK
ncbi:MAG: carbon-nitrogen hydrolase family protein [archaeon YNP-LCB-003-016]|jgi:predicted amidohydrolase|uniref:carbon-nitrogen hydrolase family protein n=1 Tax=Candidatus Culexarchaeum yellowstonense TaxID=2928963 RepID=UPI0026F31639|nr:carbon-nitrogen hydrolase family protein [Candidatus Culexarchaeum yellowstonense]MCR6691887.1 carbon-nitrogen hydrolase family protein [Candidatus Culexarchaeum yellowstonense]